MKTLMGLIIIGTLFYWLMIWDRTIKNKTKILDEIPNQDGPRQIFFLFNIISVILIVGLMLVYLP